MQKAKSDAVSERSKSRSQGASKIERPDPHQAIGSGARSTGASKRDPGRGEPVSRVEVGEKLPTATLQNQNGDAFELSSLRGKPAIVYFYPKDDTPGCTREACAFQSNLARLNRLAVPVVGISPDSPERHTKFAAKYGLDFTLLADPERDYAKRCGVLVPKTLYGKTSIGIERTTFLVDAKGVVRRVWRKVKVDGHAEQVMDAIKELSASA